MSRVSDVYSGDSEFEESSHAINLFGTLEIEGNGIFYVYFLQARTQKTWVLVKQEFFDETGKAKSRNAEQYIVAVLRSFNTGRLEGMGETYILTRLMSNISTMVYMCSSSKNITVGFDISGEYVQPVTNYSIRFQASGGGNRYLLLNMNYEGFKLSISHYMGKLPFVVPKLYPVEDQKSKAAVVANLGIKTAASLFRTMGSRLDWFKSKHYVLIDTDEKFDAMMLEFLRDVQSAHSRNKSVLVGLDTETTGLNVFNLSPDNSLRDTVVSIPFSWKDNTGYVICTDMFYFSNVSEEKVYPLFQKLFSRNKDFTFQDIELDFCGEHFHFNRKNITVSGWNVIFDEMAFMCHDCDIFFDEDGRQLFFNLDTDLVQGQKGFEKWGSYRISNSLKAQTRRLIGDETLELEDLFGKGNEDKYRYLQDAVLALIYGGADADYTRLCVKKGLAMTEPYLHNQYLKYDMTILYKMAKASWNGMPIDSTEVKRQGDLVYQDLERLKDFIYHYAWLVNRDTLNEKSDKLKELLSLDSDMQLDEDISQHKMYRYPFTPANHKKLLFNMLGYPVTKKAEKTGEPALDKYVLKKLMAVKKEQPVEVMTESLMSVADPTVTLIDKDQFNSDAYPLARVFSTYATLNKEYTSYYRPIVDNDMEGKMFYNITLARAATRRILSPAQTMKGSLKSLVIAPPKKIFMSFDASQIEYRHMASLAYIRSKEQLKEKFPSDWEKRLSETAVAKVFMMMQNEEADYHTETAAMMTGVRQHEVTHKVRKQYKTIGFGIPYGLGDRALCESLFTNVTDENMRKTKELLAHYKANQKEIIDLLESTRDSAFVPANLSDEYKEYLGVGNSHVGIVRNFVGFYRVFVLENLTRPRTGRIRRQAGNCIIQGGAAELFRRMLFNFQIGCCRAGIEDKIDWLMTVHDELDAIVDSDIDIMVLIKVLYENCTLRYTDHIPYYIGINFGANWADAKADANELPVIMVQRMIAAYDQGKFSIPSDGNQPSNLLKLKRHYMCDRIEEELRTILPNLRSGHIWTDSEVDLVDSKFANYTVRSYLDSFSKKSASLKEKLMDWTRERDKYGFGVSFLSEKLGEDEEVSLSLDFDDSDFSFDLSSDDDLELSEENQEDMWFDEVSLFDQSLPLDSILVNSEKETYEFSNTQEESDGFVENENPSNAFDIFVSTRYVRTRVLKMKDGMFSCITSGTPYKGEESKLKALVKKQFSTGSDTIIIIGVTVQKISNISCTDDSLDWLDRLVCNKMN